VFELTKIESERLSHSFVSPTAVVSHIPLCDWAVTTTKESGLAPKHRLIA